MKLFLIRHGQTDWNSAGKIQGSYDSELNNIGIVQAKELSQKILDLNYKFSRIYTSKQKRALKTAEILSESVKVDYLQIEGLEEINLGEWEGLSWLEVKEKYPKEYEEWFVNRRYTKPPQGESYQELLERVLNVIDKIVSDNTDNVMLVTHSAVIMCLQCYMTNTPFEKMQKYKADNATIVEIDSELFKAIAAIHK